MNDRSKWAVFAALLAALVGGVAVVALAGGGEDKGDGARLTVERSFVPGTNRAELIVSVNRDANGPDTATNGSTVGLVCRDERGRKVLTATVQWPFIDEPGYALPHAHQSATSEDLARIAACRLTGTTIPLRGRMKLRS